MDPQIGGLRREGATDRHPSVDAPVSASRDAILHKTRHFYITQTEDAENLGLYNSS